MKIINSVLIFVSQLCMHKTPLKTQQKDDIHHVFSISSQRILLEIAKKKRNSKTISMMH